MGKSLLHTPEGVRDIYGEEYARKLFIEQKLHETIKRYGYRDIQTPTFEFFDVYSREIGTTPSSQLYKFFDKEGNTLSLRPDFTPSCARCAAKYFMDETGPIRLTYSGNTFLNTSSLQGKRGEVTQMGAELMMEPSVRADAEMICLVIDALKDCGLTDFQITVGEVEYFKGLCAHGEPGAHQAGGEHLAHDQNDGQNQPQHAVQSHRTSSLRRPKFLHLYHSISVGKLPLANP